MEYLINIREVPHMCTMHIRFHFCLVSAFIYQNTGLALLRIQNQTCKQTYLGKLLLS